MLIFKLLKRLSRKTILFRQAMLLFHLILPVLHYYIILTTPFLRPAAAHDLTIIIILSYVYHNIMR